MGLSWQQGPNWPSPTASTLAETAASEFDMRGGHELGGSKTQSTTGFSWAPKQTCHRPSCDCLRNLDGSTKSVVPSSVVINRPSDHALMRDTG